MKKEDVGLTFSDKDFERRYSAERAGPSASGADTGSRAAQALAAPVARSRNKFMRTLLRRRMSSSGQLNT
jgi:hypothetical protein